MWALLDLHWLKPYNKLNSCALWKGRALLELAVFFRKKGEAESKVKVKIQKQEVKKSVEKLIVLTISKFLSNQICNLVQNYEN